jgi:hypothetical protein
VSIAGINSAIVTRYKDGDFQLPTFWPGVNYEPTAGAAHARAWFLPAGNDAGSLGGTGLDVIRGILQIDLMYPDGKGIGVALEKADDVAAIFERGQSEVYGTSTVVFNGATVLQPRNENGWLRVPVSVGWYSHQARSVP